MMYVPTTRINVVDLIQGDAIRVKQGWVIADFVRIESDHVKVDIRGWSQPRILRGFVTIAERG